jgi:glycosyltransferase involved in cell wall biosynthesis
MVTETWAPEINGVAMTISRLMMGALSAGHRVHIIRPIQSVEDDSSNATAFGELHKDFSTTRVYGMAIPFYSGLQVGFARGAMLDQTFRKTRPDIVHIVTEGPLGMSALRAARRAGIPVVTSFHTNFHTYSDHYGLSFLKSSVLRYLRRFHRQSAVTLVPTREVAENLQHMHSLTTRVLSRGVDTQLFSPWRRSAALRASWGVERNDPVSLYVGRLASEKNLQLALEAFDAIRVKVPNAKFVVVGSGPLESWLRKRPADSGVLLVGTKTGTELARYYASADIFLFPSRSETFGNVTLEAMASGLAVCAFDYAAAWHYIESGTNGATCALDDDACFAQNAILLATNLTCSWEMGAHARETVLPLGWSRIQRQLIDIYRSVLNSDAPTGQPGFDYAS